MVGSEWTSLTADLVAALAWPVAIVGILFLFRTQVAALIPHVTRVGVGSMQIDLDTAVDDVSKRVNQAAGADLTGTDAKVAPPTPVAEHATDLVGDAWQQVQSQLRTLAQRFGIGGADAASLADGLADRNLISSHLGTAVRELDAVQRAGPRFDDRQARSLAQSAQWITKILDSAPTLDLVAAGTDDGKPADHPVAAG